MPSDVIHVKIGAVPGEINDYALNAGASVKDALEAAELEENGFTVKVDGSAISDTTSTILNDGSRVYLYKKISGNR